MLKTLIKMEWYRFWKSRIIRLSFIIIPFIIFITSKYIMRMNSEQPGLVNSTSFTYLVLKEQITLIMDLLVIYYLVSSITQEFRSGEIRMILSRGVKKEKIIAAKVLVVSVVMAAYMLLYGLFAYIYANNFIPNGNSIIINHLGKVQIKGIQAALYTIKFYIIAYITILSFMALISFICVVSKNITIASGIAVGVWLMLEIYPKICSIFIKNVNALMLTASTSIEFIQEYMISALAVISLKNNITIILIILLYGIIFYSASVYFIKKENYLE